MSGYLKYLGKKFGWYLVTLFVAVLLNFLLPRLIPGNPVANLVANATTGMTDAQAIKRIYDAYMVEFGLDKPIWQQFFIYIGKLFQGDMGKSFNQYPREVSEIIATAVPWTLRLQIPAIITGWFLGNALGALAAYRKGIFDRVFFPFFLFISAIPAFGLGIVLVHFLANTLHLFPGRLGYAFDMLINWKNPAFILSMLNHYRLPFLTMVLVAIGGQSLGMREMSIYELNADYVKYSRLLGIKDSRIVWYVFRNAMLPQITGLALSLGTMIGGNLIAEIVFSYPGIGTTMLLGISSQDFPLISGCTLIVTVTVLAANFLVDIVCGIIDPRIRLTQQEEG
ncbi:MAG: ABC transporter permease [Spirochaetaceae bacterium]|jgi:peptide/nickel transport system permease protein|nr:ABC transporter permease [Spirochaetaceae bacterium]